MPNKKLKSNQLPREVLVLSVVGFFVAVGYGLIVPAIPIFARSFGVNKTAIGLVISSFAMARFGSGLISGRLVDRFGERKTLAVGLLMVSLSSLAAGLAQNYWQLLSFRAAGGLGSSMFSVSAGALLMRSVSDDQRAQGQSFYNSGFLLGGIAGPAFGGILSAISLRAPFFVYAVTLLMASFVAYFFLNEKRLGSKVASVQDPNDRISIRDALKVYPYRVTLVLAFVTNWVLFGLRNSILPLFVKENLHSTTTIVGLGFTVSALAQGALLIYAGKISDHKGRRFAILIGTSLLMSALGALILANHPWLYFAAMILFGLGGAFMGTAPASVVGDLFGGKGGQVIAIWQMAGDAGMIVGPIVLGYLADLISYRAAFIASAIVFSIAIVLGSTLKETRKSHIK
ncbi:MAG: MFS transporter [Actinomycetes bacterium]